MRDVDVAAGPLTGLRNSGKCKSWRRSTTEVHFHCSDDSHELIDGSGTAVSDLSGAFAHAHGRVRATLMTPNAEDWRGWELRFTDEFGGEIFTVPFASVLGELH